MSGDKSFQRLQEEGDGFSPVEHVQIESNVMEWTTKQVGDFLGRLGLGQHTRTFEQHRITGDLLHCLNESHLKELGIALVGERIVLLREVQRIRRHAVNRVRFSVIWEDDAEVYTNGPGDWVFKQLCCEPCCEQPDHYKLTASSLSLTMKTKKLGFCRGKSRTTRNIDLSNVAGVSEFHGKECCDGGCTADWIYIELDGEKGLEPVPPLAVKRGEGDAIALKIQMAMEEAQAQASGPQESTMQRD